MVPSDGKFISRPSTKSLTLFKRVFQCYPTRQHLFGHLNAFDVSKLIVAAGCPGVVGEKEREKYLDPMRDLFTDQQLEKLRVDLAALDNHHFVLFGPDLLTLFDRIKTPEQHDSNKILDIWVIELSTSRKWHDQLYDKDPVGDLPEFDSSRPSLFLPGRWQNTGVHRFETYPETGAIVWCQTMDRDDGIRLHHSLPVIFPIDLYDYAYLAEAGNLSELVGIIGVLESDTEPELGLKDLPRMHSAECGVEQIPAQMPFIRTSDMRKFTRGWSPGTDPHNIEREEGCTILKLKWYRATGRHDNMYCYEIFEIPLEAET